MSKKKKVGKHIFHAPELIAGKWWHLVESTDADVRIKPYGPFESEQAAYAHREALMKGNHDVIFPQPELPPD